MNIYMKPYNLCVTIINLVRSVSTLRASFANIKLNWLRLRINYRFYLKILLIIDSRLIISITRNNNLFKDIEYTK